MLNGKKILVTGGCGFIGSHIVEKLLTMGANVVVLDDLSTGRKENIAHVTGSITFIQGSITNNDDLDKAVAGVDFICHQAALPSVPKSIEEPLRFHHVNATGTLQLLQKAKEHGVRRVAMASSCAIYGDGQVFPQKEDDPIQPLSPYTITKLSNEKYGKVFSSLYGVSVVALRYFNVFGPRQLIESYYAGAIPCFIDKLLQSQTPVIYGDGSQQRDFIYVENIVEANICALLKDNIGGNVFNVGTGASITINDCLAVIAKVMGKKVSADFAPARAADIRKSCADITKATTLLQWRPSIFFEEGIAKTVQWFQQR